MKICTKCGIEKPRSEYSNDKRKYDGLRPSCKECSRKYLQAHRLTSDGLDVHRRASSAYYHENRERILTEAKRFRVENPDVDREIRARYVERRRKNSKDWVSRNKAHIAEYRIRTKDQRAERMANYWKNNRDKARAIKAKYRSAKIKATPKWANLDAIRAWYTFAAVTPGVHVDHIVPLNSPIVCGLHCEFNLQLLPASENMSKGNRYWPDMPI